MAGPVDAFLKVSIAAAALFASASVGYYYVLYLPQRDAQIDIERQIEAAKTELARQADQARQAAEKRDAEEKQAAVREAVQARYRNCVRRVEVNYSAQWTGECKRIADKAAKDHKDCLAKATFGKEVCDTMYADRNSPSECSLPRMLANDITEILDKGRKRCFDESQAGLQ